MTVDRYARNKDVRDVKPCAQLLVHYRQKTSCEATISVERGSCEESYSPSTPGAIDAFKEPTTLAKFRDPISDPVDE